MLTCCSIRCQNGNFGFLCLFVFLTHKVLFCALLTVYLGVWQMICPIIQEPWFLVPCFATIFTTSSVSSTGSSFFIQPCRRALSRESAWQFMTSLISLQKQSVDPNLTGVETEECVFNRRKLNAVHVASFYQCCTDELSWGSEVRLPESKSSLWCISSETFPQCPSFFFF